MAGVWGKFMLSLRDSPNNTQGNLSQGIDQRLELALDTAFLRLHLGIGTRSQDLAPEVDNVNVLPVVHRSEGFRRVGLWLLALASSRWGRGCGSYDSTQVDSERTDEAESVRVASSRVQCEELGGGVLGQVDRGEGVGGGVAEGGKQGFVSVLSLAVRA